MKKFTIAFAVLFVIIFGCKKIDENNGGGLCACSPVQSTAYLNLVIKNAGGEDLLSSTTTGSFSQSQILLYSKDANGIIKQISFSIRPPFSYGGNQFDYYQLMSQEIAILAKSIDNTYYLKLGNQAPYEVNLQVNSNLSKVEKVLIDKKEVPKETGKVATYYGMNIYYLNL
ncbi:hypothetical protein EZ428_10160 [Pedobacter frigiditerrae]|uniref:Uncharacterized protein n=1 Tax=Pedobacter frigiditerrae TaxID=2530452 RepID=A0A4V2MIW6_9SPHI|nr:hypothetical protein [Pedobacter frigiditerrae]TCC92086.1 hypothetical protein EZ428_10160 [Pedobacter frigiditerrae]